MCVIQSRQQHHQLEVERLALKAKEDAMNVKQAAESAKVKSNVEGINERERIFDERRKMDIQMQVCK